MRLQIILMAVLVCLAAGLRLANLDNVTTRTPDERVYTTQANVWLKSGQSGLRSLVEQYKSDPELRLYPPPIRVGMIRLVAVAMRLTGRYDESAGSLISCAASIASVLVLALLGIRFLTPWAGLAAVLFYAVLPADLAIARRTWTDALVELAGLLLVYLMCEITRNSRLRIWYVFFGLTGAIGLLVKESMPLPEGLCALWILWILLRRREWSNILVFTAATLGSVMLSLWWLSSQVGNLGDYVQIVAAIPGVNALNPYALEYASGPGYLLLFAFWIVTPIPSLLSLAGLWELWSLRLKPRTLPGGWEPLGGVAFFAVAHIAIAMAVPHWLNLRYVSVAFGPFCMLAGLGCLYLVSASRRLFGLADWRPVVGVALIVVIMSAVTDYQYFQRVFVREQTPDLTIRMLMDERNSH